jgi:hypothetical protein
MTFFNLCEHPKMDGYPTHWRDTLMGWDFWKSTAVYEEELDQKQEQEQEQAKSTHPSLLTDRTNQLAVQSSTPASPSTWAPSKALAQLSPPMRQPRRNTVVV